MNICSLFSFASRSRFGGAFARAGLTAALSIGISSVAVAQDSLTEDFESYWSGAVLGTPWSTINGGATISVTTDNADLFEQGSNNLILDYHKQQAYSGSTSVFYANNAFSVEVGRLSFDFVQTEDGGEGPLWVILHVGGRVSGSDRRAALFDIGNGTISNTPSYALGALTRVEVFFNNSESETIRYNDEYLLAPGTVDFWVNGELVEAGASRHSNMRGPITTLEFNSSSARLHRFLFDNIAVEPIEYEIPPPMQAPEPQEIFRENFASQTVGAIPGEPWTTVTNNPERTGSALVQNDAGDLFGKGTNNKILDYISRGDGAIVARSENTFSSELITFSVRMLTPTQEDPVGYSWFIFNAGSVSGTNNRVQLFTLEHRPERGATDGFSRIGDAFYPQNVPVQIDLVINNGPLAVEYADGQIVESGMADIWVNGELGHSGFSNSNNQKGPVTTFELNVSSSQSQRLLVDEIVIYNSARVSSAPGTGGFADWRAVHFPDNAENDEVSGPAANPTGDGVPNLLKYALGLDPAVASREGLPVTETRDIEGVEYLTISFDRPSARDDVSYSVVATSDLEGWTDQAVLVEAIDNGDGTVTEIWRDPQPLASSSARFLRLEVSLQ